MKLSHYLILCLQYKLSEKEKGGNRIFLYFRFLKWLVLSKGLSFKIKDYSCYFGSLDVISYPFFSMTLLYILAFYFLSQKLIVLSFFIWLSFSVSLIHSVSLSLTLSVSLYLYLYLSRSIFSLSLNILVLWQWIFFHLLECFRLVHILM